MKAIRENEIAQIVGNKLRFLFVFTFRNLDE